MLKNIWPNGGTRANILTAETLDLVSSSAQDAVGGSGLHRVVVDGLDVDGKMQTEIVVLTGTTPVTTTKTFSEIYYVRPVEPSSSVAGYIDRVFAGNISITNTASGQVLGYIPAGKTDTALSHYIVPVGYEAAIHEMYVGASDSGDMKVTFQYRLPDETLARLQATYRYKRYTSLINWHD